MIAWLNPVALAGLALIAGPILVHLLRHPRAVRVPFPTLRFVQPSRTAAARMRRVSDPWLLLLRMLLVALAAAAAAQPVVLTPGRLAAWNQRVARAVVIDASGSSADADARAARAAQEAAAAFASTIVEPGDLRSGVAVAASWLASAPPARRELVIVSDLRAGSIPLDLERHVPGGAGLRVTAVGELPSERTYRGPAGFGASRAPQVRLTADATHVSWVPAPEAPAGVRIEGASEADVSRLTRIAAAAGAPAGRDDRRVILTFDPSALAAAEPFGAGWMPGAAAAIAADEDVLRAARARGAPALAGEGPSVVIVARGGDGRPLVRAARRGEALVVQVAAGPGDLVSAAVLVAALRAAHGSAARPEQEVARMSPVDLARIVRDPAPVDASLVRQAERSDAPWVWLAVLALLGAETWARRAHPAPRQEAEADAA